MYQITFQDNSIFDGGDVFNSKWNEIPNKPIKKIQYSFINKIITFENYEAYNHLIEHLTFFNSNKSSYINKIRLLAKKNNDVLMLELDFLKKNITWKTVKYKQEINKKPITGWKIGIKNKKCYCDIN